MADMPEEAISQAAILANNPSFIPNIPDAQLGTLMTTMWNKHTSRKQQEMIVLQSLKLITTGEWAPSDAPPAAHNGPSHSSQVIVPPESPRGNKHRSIAPVPTPSKRTGYGMFDESPEQKRPKVNNPINPLDEDLVDEGTPIPASYGKPTRGSYIKKEPSATSDAEDEIDDGKSSHSNPDSAPQTLLPRKQKAPAAAPSAGPKWRIATTNPNPNSGIKPGGSASFTGPLAKNPLPHLQKLLWIPDKTKKSKRGYWQDASSLPPSTLRALETHFASSYLIPDRAPKYKSWYNRASQGNDGQRCINNIVYSAGTFKPKYSAEGGDTERCCDTCTNRKRICGRL
ncbi:hypothetical protein CC80DRAFT_311114 [Byssothecium circinans]|uniref:Uncharacterized protein n=1 Tax=Byssothecium circinans TaxID=147558 RepID=A0A6A5U567_9PLEO|nr:hypothetical protein CC80DRAFT_311114 [Byssothecium circinans]